MIYGGLAVEGGPAAWFFAVAGLVFKSQRNDFFHLVLGQAGFAAERGEPLHDFTALDPHVQTQSDIGVQAGAQHGIGMVHDARGAEQDEQGVPEDGLGFRELARALEELRQGD